MPALDSFLHDPLTSGGTIDTDAEQAVPTFRAEPFQIEAAKGLPISMKSRTRPVTHRINHQLTAGVARVMHRDSNNNPDNAGGDAVTSHWNLSDPWQSHLADTPASLPLGKLALAGLALGALFYFSRNR